jgi:MFS-type transporter involved in bile tolerance (Atg22 family)
VADRDPAETVGAAIRWLGRAGVRSLTRKLGGAERTRVIVLLAAVLALSSADATTVGAAAMPLRQALGISNTDIGLLVTVTSLVAALASLPFGVLADRACAAPGYSASRSCSGVPR